MDLLRTFFVQYCLPLTPQDEEAQPIELKEVKEFPDLRSITPRAGYGAAFYYYIPSVTVDDHGTQRVLKGELVRSGTTYFNGKIISRGDKRYPAARSAIIQKSGTAEKIDRQKTAVEWRLNCFLPFDEALDCVLESTVI